MATRRRLEIQYTPRTETGAGCDSSRSSHGPARGLARSRMVVLWNRRAPRCAASSARSADVLSNPPASAGRRLAEAAGAKYVLFAGAEASPAFHGVSDGDVLELGNVTAEALHVPGHTPEHICLLVTDRTRAQEPWFVLTGHTLMVGDVGRTELASDVEAGARDLFHSLGRLKALPDYVEILPGAFAGSVCGRSLSGRPMSTIGFEKRHNAAFRIDDEEEFLRAMSKDIPPPPAGAAELRAANAGRAPA